MAIAVVQTKGIQAGNVASQALAFDSNVTSGNQIVVCIAHYYNRGYTVTDSQGNTYTKDVDRLGSGGTYRDAIWRTVAGSSAACTVTVTNTPDGNNYTTIGMGEFSGEDSADLLEGTTSKEDAGTAIETGTVTPAADGALFVGVMTHGESGAPTLTQADTLLYENEGTSNVPINAAYFVQGTAGADEVTWTSSASLAIAPALLAVYNAATGGGGGSTMLWNILTGLPYGSLVGGRLVR